MKEVRNAAELPKATAVLLLVGGLLVLLSGVLALLGMPTGFTFMEGHLMIQPLQGISIYHGIIEVLSGAVLVASAIYINSGNATKIQNWAIVGLVFSFISLIGGGGFFIGFVLGLVGSVLAIVYNTVAIVRPAYTRPVGVRTGRKTEVLKEVRPNRVLATLKTEERKLYDLTKDAGGAIFQADLVDKSGFSKVKVSRILDKLEGRGLIERKRRGMTNMVVLKQETA